MEIQREFNWPDPGSPQWRLLNDFQRDLPLTAAPFAALARAVELTEEQVLSQIKTWQQEGVVTRVGAVFRPQALGPSTLAAVAVAPEQQIAVAEFINTFPEVNHNYEREGDVNLWFVVTAASEERLQEILLAVGERAGTPVVDCRLLYEFRIDLGFSLAGDLEETRSFVEGDALGPAVLAPRERALCELLEEGLALCSRPFDEWATQLGCSADEVVKLVRELQSRGVIRRFGLVLRHRPLGYQANAMVVWQIPRERVLAIGRALAQKSFVTLCYERKTSPTWPFNLYCMIHGRSRTEVLQQVNGLISELGLTEFAHRVLFSTKVFKQRGSNYSGKSRKASTVNDIDAVLVSELQKGIAVTDRPFADVARRLGITEQDVCARLKHLREDGVLTRFGPMYNIEKLGGDFSLVAMEVPRERWDEVAEIVNRFPEVAHNYEREHRLNMWFVVAALPASQMDLILAKIEQATGLKTYSMPKLKEFYLNLQLEAAGD